MQIKKYVGFAGSFGPFCVILEYSLWSEIGYLEILLCVTVIGSAYWIFRSIIFAKKPKRTPAATNSDNKRDSRINLPASEANLAKKATVRIGLPPKPSTKQTVRYLHYRLCKSQIHPRQAQNKPSGFPCLPSRARHRLILTKLSQFRLSQLNPRWMSRREKKLASPVPLHFQLQIQVFYPHRSRCI